MANHLTPSELADEMNMKRRDVISKCMEMNVPIFHGRIDKTLFVSNLRRIGKGTGTPSGRLVAAGDSPSGSFPSAGVPRPYHCYQRGRGTEWNRLLVERSATEAATGREHARRPAPRRRAQARRRSARVLYKDDSGTWVSKTYTEVGEIVRKLSLGLIEPRDREGRQGRDPLEHAARVDLLRLRRALGRRHRRPDLPDQLAGGVPVRARELRRGRGDRRGRRAAREDPPGPRAVPRSSST